MKTYKEKLAFWQVIFILQMHFWMIILKFMNQIREGTLEPFSSVELDFNFSPLFPGKFKEYYCVQFEDKDSKEVFYLFKIS